MTLASSPRSILFCTALIGCAATIARGAEGDSLLGESKMVDDAAVMPLKLNAKTLLPCMVWADETGSAFYALDSNGVLRLISFPEFKVLKEKDLGRKVSWLALSAEGPVVTVADKGEVWLLDPDKFEVKTKIDAPGVKRAVSAPSVSVAAACGDKLFAVDLKSGKAVKFDPPPKKLMGYAYPAMTPDGQYLFTVAAETLLRFALKDGQFTLDETGPRQGNGFVICISLDSKLVCLPSPTGHTAEGKNYGTTIYPTSSFAKPECSLESGAYPTLVGFDPAGGWIYGQNGEFSLLVFNAGGVKKKEYKLTAKRPDAIRQFLTHPAGNKLLALIDDKVYSVELPGKK